MTYLSPTIFNIVGVSGAGKDTVAEMLSRLLPNTRAIKWVQLTKDAIEAAYNLPIGAMNDREERLAPIAPEKWGSFSYLDLLVEMARVKMNSELTFGLNTIVKDIATAVREGQHVLLTDTRMPAEADALVGLARKGYRVVTIFVFGRGTVLDSDCHLKANLDKVADAGTYVYHLLNAENNLDTLKLRLQDLLLLIVADSQENG